jgi:hypothetical protein
MTSNLVEKHLLGIRMKNKKLYATLYDAIVVTNKLEPRFYKAAFVIPYYVKCADYNIEKWKDVIFETLVKSIEHCIFSNQTSAFLTGPKLGKIPDKFLTDQFVSIALIPELVMYANNVFDIVKEGRLTMSDIDHSYNCGLNPLRTSLVTDDGFGVFLWGSLIVIDNNVRSQLNVDMLIKYKIVGEPKKQRSTLDRIISFHKFFKQPRE